MTITRPAVTARRWLMWAVCVLALPALLANGGLRQDEIECEEAVAYFHSCCPSFSPSTVACVYSSGCTNTVRPDLSIETSECLLSASCDQIVAAGLCTETSETLPARIAGPTTPTMFATDPLGCQ